jgi:hypothetical protein
MKFDYKFSSVKELMKAMEAGEVKPHSTILIRELPIYLTGDLPIKKPVMRMAQY